MDKSKFTRDPQLDSEGFLDQYQMAYGCHGCAPDEPCPRSGHCLRYDSPLRYMVVSDLNEVVVEPRNLDYTNPHLNVGYRTVPADLVGFQNPKGWQEVDGVSLPSVWDWAEEGE